MCDPGVPICLDGLRHRQHSGHRNTVQQSFQLADRFVVPRI
jgi:hypothetical protein